MKTLHTRVRNRTGALIGFGLALTFAASSFLSLQNGSSRMTAAAVAEGGDRTSEVAAQVVLPDAIAENLTTNPTEKAAASRNARTLGSGEASFYGREFAGRPTANGETFDPAGLTAAHRTLPFGSKVRVTNAHNGRSVVVRINDRGPFVEDRLIDVSSHAARQLGMVRSGTARVKLELLS